MIPPNAGVMLLNVKYVKHKCSKFDPYMSASPETPHTRFSRISCGNGENRENCEKVNHELREIRTPTFRELEATSGSEPYMAK